MKKALTFICLLFISACASNTQNTRGNRLDLEIVQLFGFDLPQTPSLKNINTFAQKQFLRPKHAERLSPQSIQHYKNLLSTLTPQQKEELKSLFHKKGFVTEIMPDTKSPDYVLIMGSTLPTMRSYLMFLDHLIKEKHIIPHPQMKLIFLTGDRPLFTSETKEVLIDPRPFKTRNHWRAPKILPTNETELSTFLWAQLNLNSKLLKLNPHHIKAIKRKGTKRATTDDTIKALSRQLSLSPGSVLVIAGPPFIHYQLLVTETLFLKNGLHGFSFEGAGPAAFKGVLNDVQLGILLDTFARTIFQQLQLEKQTALPSKQTK